MNLPWNRRLVGGLAGASRAALGRIAKQVLAPSAHIGEPVLSARRRQQERFAGKPHVIGNARMGTSELKSFCVLDEATQELLKIAMAESKLAAHACNRFLKAGRTIADLMASEGLTSKQISEAIPYRSLDRQLWE